jgi:septal ring factor EnvC (AmiA/AmiB activator)
MNQMQAIQEQIDELKTQLESLEQQERENRNVHFDHTHAYYRSDREKWVTRWNNKPYDAKHIKYCEAKEDAVRIARQYDEIASFVIQCCEAE